MLDHSLDLIHRPFWYLAWGHSLPASLDWQPRCGGGYFAGRLLEGLFCWYSDGVALLAPDRLAVPNHHGAAQPNLIFLSVGALAGRPTSDS